MPKISGVRSEPELAVPVARNVPRPARVSDIEVGDTLLSLTSDLSVVEAEWRSFEQIADCTPFQTFAWLDTWQTCIGTPKKVTPVIITAQRRSGELLFVIPLAIEPRMGHRRLVFLGRDLGDYNAPLLAPEFQDVIGPTKFSFCWHALCAYLDRKREYRHDVIVLDKMPAQVGGQPNPFCALPTVLNPSRAHPAPLGSDWDTFYAEKRSSKTRRRDRTKRKRLSEYGEVSFSEPQSAKAVQQTLDILFAQKSRYFARKGVADLFAKPGRVDFYSTLADAAPSLVHISRLDVGLTCAAANLGLSFKRCYYHILASHDDGPLSRFGPGIVHLHELMRHAIIRNCDRFDFTIGDEPYKDNWVDKPITLHDHVSANGGLGQLVATLILLKTRAKRFIKNSPKLWRLTNRVRAMRRTTKARTASTAASPPLRTFSRP